MQKNPNTLKVFLMGYLDGMKRASTIRAPPNRFESHYTKITDPKLLEDSYQEGKKVWNKDMTVDAEAIKLVLEQSTVAKAAEMDPAIFRQHTDQGSKPRLRGEMFPGQIK